MVILAMSIIASVVSPAAALVVVAIIPTVVAPVVMVVAMVMKRTEFPRTETQLSAPP
jgi:hypothetical protein